MTDQEQAEFKSGFVALAGVPNVGKSTLMNAVLGRKISAVTSKPQTTRNRIVGVHTLPGQGQIIFVDTPGIHTPHKELNAVMVDNAWGSIGSTDLVLMMIDAPQALDADGQLNRSDTAIARRLATMGLPVVAAVNKIDRLASPEEVLPTIAALHAVEGLTVEAVVPISALEKDGLEALVQELLTRLQPGPQFYPDDMITDQAERFIAAELIREKLMLQTRREIPYSSAVTVEEFRDDTRRQMLRMRAVIHVERDSQKGIVIGKRGARLKQIGSQARADLERFFGRKIYLDLHVTVDRDWSQNPALLRRLGYDREDF